MVTEKEIKQIQQHIVKNLEPFNLPEEDIKKVLPTITNNYLSIKEEKEFQPESIFFNFENKINTVSSYFNFKLNDYITRIAR